MIKIEKTEIYGWEAAIRGMRNPMNSWDKSDSHCTGKDDFIKVSELLSRSPLGTRITIHPFTVGLNDLKLMMSLSKAGSDHAKFLRMINVTCDITAPLYWWKEYDTYKVGTVANSCSTMHKIHDKEFELDDFSHEHLDMVFYDDKSWWNWETTLENIIDSLNCARERFLETKDKKFWWQMIQLLPSSYNQKRTVQLNYQVLQRMYHARKNHKLDEWRDFCKWCETLPYFKEICIQDQ